MPEWLVAGEASKDNTWGGEEGDWCPGMAQPGICPLQEHCTGLQDSVLNIVMFSLLCTQFIRFIIIFSFKISQHNSGRMPRYRRWSWSPPRSCCWETWMKILFFEKSEWKSQNEKTFFQFSVLRQEQVYLSTNLVFLERNRKWLSEKKWSWFSQEFTRTRIPATLCGSVHPFSNSVWR